VVALIDSDGFLRRHDRLRQYDIKRVLAYSTVSQLVYGLWVGWAAYAAGIFHLMTHAFSSSSSLERGVYARHERRTGHEKDGRSAQKDTRYYWTCLIAASQCRVPGYQGFSARMKYSGWHTAVTAGNIWYWLSAQSRRVLPHSICSGCLQYLPRRMQGIGRSKTPYHESPKIMTIRLPSSLLSMPGG